MQKGVQSFHCIKMVVTMNPCECGYYPNILLTFWWNIFYSLKHSITVPEQPYPVGLQCLCGIGLAGFVAYFWKINQSMVYHLQIYHLHDV